MSVKSNLYWAGVAAVTVNALHQKSKIVNDWRRKPSTRDWADTLSDNRVFVPLALTVSLSWPVTLPLATAEALNKLRKTGSVN